LPPPTGEHCRKRSLSLRAWNCSGSSSPCFRPGLVVARYRDSRTQFRDLLFRRGPARFYAFDQLWLNGEDLRLLSLIERKRLLRELVPQDDPYLLYCNHVKPDGTALFEQACNHDLEGVVAKRKDVRTCREPNPTG
jgi:ATP dependent DNA ligase-like protein